MTSREGLTLLLWPTEPPEILPEILQHRGKLALYMRHERQQKLTSFHSPVEASYQYYHCHETDGITVHI